MTRKSILFVFLMYFMNNIYSQNTCDTLKWQCTGMYFCENATVVDTLPQMQIDPSIYPDLQFKCVYKNMSNQTYYVGEELTVPIYVNISLKDVGFIGYVKIPMKVVLDKDIIPMGTVTSISDKSNIKQFIFDPIEEQYGDNWYNLIDFCRVKAYVDGTTTDGRFSDSIYYTYAYSTDITFKSPDNIASHCIEKNIACFPNPASFVLTIESKDLIIENICFYDILGKKLKCIQVEANKTVIDIDDLPIGMYIIIITTAEGMLTRKIQVVR